MGFRRVTWVIGVFAAARALGGCGDLFTGGLAEGDGGAPFQGEGDGGPIVQPPVPDAGELGDGDVADDDAGGPEADGAPPMHDAGGTAHDSGAPGVDAGPVQDAGGPPPPPPNLSPLTGVSLVRAGYGHTCAVAGGRVYCWGDDTFGQLGNGSTDEAHAAVVVPGISDARAVVSGGFHTCALDGAGAVTCWGRNDRGQLGTKGGDARSPQPVGGIGAVVELAAGASHTCVRRANGNVLCWGANESGELGDGTTRPSPMAVKVAGLMDAVQIAAGGNHTCARRQSGAVVCWGDDSKGQLGSELTPPAQASASPLPVGGLADATWVALGVGSTSCAARATGAIACWGDDSLGQLGVGTVTSAATYAPADVHGVSGAIAVAVGYAHACAWTNQSVQCWGGNLAGQLGNGTQNDASSPVTVSGVVGPLAMTAGYRHTCALQSNGQVRCWGENTHGAVGDGTTVERDTPVTVRVQ